MSETSMGSVVSPAFEEVFRDSGTKQEAIVVFEPALPQLPRMRGRLRALDARLRQVAENSAAQRPVQREVISKYLHEFSGRVAEGSLRADEIGSSVLNVMGVQVTPESLASL